MSTVPLHPALVHAPLALALVLPIVAAGLTFALWRGLLPRRSWLVFVALQALLVVAGVVALETGEREEDRVERVVGKAALHDHEEAAELFVWGAAVVLAAGAAVLAAPAPAAAAVAAVAFAGTLAVSALAIRAGKAGGELVYVHGAASAYAPPVAAAPSGDDDDHPDD